MKEPELVTIVFGHLPAAQICALLSASSVWMLASDQNSREIDAAEKSMDLRSLPGQISLAPRSPSQDIADWLRKTLDEVDRHHDGSLWTQWRRIDVRGLGYVPELQAVAGDFGEVRPIEGGFAITYLERDD